LLELLASGRSVVGDTTNRVVFLMFPGAC
jgi:hypothetical protein